MMVVFAGVWDQGVRNVRLVSSALYMLAVLDPLPCYTLLPNVFENCVGFGAGGWRLKTAPPRFQ